MAKSPDKDPGMIFASSTCGQVVCTTLVLDEITEVSALSRKIWISEGIGRVVDAAEDVERVLVRGKVT